MNLQGVRTTVQIVSESADGPEDMGNSHKHWAQRRVRGPSEKWVLESWTWSYLVVHDYKNVCVVRVRKQLKRVALVEKEVVVVVGWCKL